MMNRQLRGKDLFDVVVQRWYRRTNPEEELTLNQIANISLGSGTSTNAGIVGRTLHEFRDYFHMAKLNGRKVRVNWTNVKRDHPHLLVSGPVLAQSKLSPAPPTSPIEGMVKALADEIQAVKRDTEKNPIKALGAHALGQWGEGSFLYEAVIEIERDAELPIPEGVSILLRWWGYHWDSNFVEGTLLSYSPLESTVIFEVQRPLSQKHLSTDFNLLPRTEELLKAVQGKVNLLPHFKSALPWRLLNGETQPVEKAWNQKVIQQGLDQSQLRTVQKCLGQDITFLWGPPGTGKTHTLARLIASVALGGKKVIATAIANVAVDQLSLGVLKALSGIGSEGQALLNEGRVLRFGHPRLPEVSGEPRLFPNKAEAQRLRKALHNAHLRLKEIPESKSFDRALLNKEIKELSSGLKELTKRTLENACIVLTTAVQTCIETAFNEVRFDMAIVDEASMMPIPYLTAVGMLGQERFVIAGDFRQLGPIALSQSQLAFDWLHKDAFELAGVSESVDKGKDHPLLEMLSTQRRMHSRICDLINKPFYKGELLTDVKDKGLRGMNLSPLPGEPVAFVSLGPEDGSVVEQTASGSRRNFKSAEVVTQLACRYVQHDSEVQVGIITPYRAQVSQIKHNLKKANLDKQSSERIKVGTIHAFQGSENDVILWDLVETRSHKIGKLYQGKVGERLTNVAISRAKGKLVIVGDKSAFTLAPGANLVGRLCYILSAHFPPGSPHLVSVSELA